MAIYREHMDTVIIKNCISRMKPRKMSYILVMVSVLRFDYHC